MRGGRGRPERHGLTAFVLATTAIVAGLAVLVAVLAGSREMEEALPPATEGERLTVGEEESSADQTGGSSLPDSTVEVISEKVGPDVVRLLDDGITEFHVNEELVSAAQGVLFRYQERGDCVLAQAGYLDLMGNVWACTVQGDGWVEVTVLRSCGEEGGCDVTTVLMDASVWARELEGLGIGEDGQ